MDHLTVHEVPPVKINYLITTFKGWPDAGEGASSAVRYLLRKLPAKKFAEIDAEEFYDFTQARPQTSVTREGLRVVKWPSNELFYWAAEEPSPSLMFFVGLEPNLKWKTFSRAIVDAAASWGVKTVIHVGSLLDAVPHTRAVRITGSADGIDLKTTLEKNNISASNYQGPTGITSAIMEACAAKKLSYATMWAHPPHYLHAAPNYRVSLCPGQQPRPSIGFPAFPERVTGRRCDLRSRGRRRRERRCSDRRVRTEARAAI